MSANKTDLSNPEVVQFLKEHGLVDMVDDDAQHEQESQDEGASTDQHLDNAEIVVPLLAASISIQALLAQFMHPQVRADLLNKQFELHSSPKLLAKLDEIRWTLFPRWQGGSLELAQQQFTSAAKHLKALINKCEEPFVLPDDQLQGSMTYSQWYATLQAVAADKYWNRVPPADRCTHTFQEHLCKRETLNRKVKVAAWSPSSLLV